MTWSLKARQARAGIAAAACITASVSCSDFLEVQDPSRFTDESLNTPLALAAVANGVEADVLQLVDDFGWRFGQMSDELTHTGTWNPDADRDKGRDPSQLGTGGYQQNLLVFRTSAQKARERFLNVMGDTANRTLLMARVVAVEAWTNVYLGMYNCESPKAPLGEIVSSVDMFKLAVPIFTEAANIAKIAGSTNHELWAIAGRARANLFAGNHAAALADAQLIPSSFVYTAKFSATSAGNTLVSFAHRSRLKAAGLDTHHWSKVDTIAGFVRDPYTGQHDRRLPITHQPNERGADGVTQYYNQEKFDAIDDDIVQVSGWEMRLIEAEVHLQQGNLAQAMTLINAVRANAGLDPVVATDAAKVREHLLWERFAQFFLEGMRFYDLHRFNLHGTVLGTGRPTQYPLDGTEINLNPNTNGRLDPAERCFPKS
jgi:hypothetical protein